ncbi:diaminopimelate epimerase [Halosquirtibacter xylanolyticus]|uniref:diaminopimelate epimerase n=1 Tax=Halosquirtibacter xylanolyticus TaxID=3374599 RepID=UPI00374892F8|nr:diaminopimelate epimerase [Prolixibacteraceae bacterium]
MKSYRFHKYQGAGNDFVIIDNRDNKFDANNIELVRHLCDRRFGVGADGLMLLESDALYAFRMRYYNSDGREATMCGNGGRCIVAFAHFLGIFEDEVEFIAVDGVHKAKMDEDQIVDLEMIDVDRIERVGEDFYLNTGSPHYVTFCQLEGLDVVEEGRKIRYNNRFAKEGTNVNFVQMDKDVLHVLTYERGVEDETLACGTGVTAAAISACVMSNSQFDRFKVFAKGGELEVRFDQQSEQHFRHVWLKGPAIRVFNGEIHI